MKRALFCIVLFILAVSLACSSSTPSVRTPGGESVAVSNQESEPTTAPLGTTRSNPAPVGSEIDADDMTFKITGITRPADEIVAAGNMFNATPTPEQEYVIVEVSAACNKSTDDKCNLGLFSFSLLGSRGVDHDAELMVAGVDNVLEPSAEFYGGATVSGRIVFLAGKGETDLLLVYDPLLGDKFYLAVE